MNETLHPDVKAFIPPSLSLKQSLEKVVLPVKKTVFIGISENTASLSNVNYLMSQANI